MLGEEDSKEWPSGGNNQRTYSRSVSWTDRSPRKSTSRPQWNSKARGCLPPLQPLSITRVNVEEWPKAGSDDLGIWPTNPPTPGVRLGPIKNCENSNSEQTPREFEFKKDKLAFFDKECSRIVDHVYLGSDAVAKNREVLRQNGITHVLNCVGFVCPEYFKNDLVYKTLWLQDSPSEDITSILYDVFDYFEDVREQGGRVLVHCCQGVSRSTSLVIAYLMWKEGQSFEDAFQYVKTARGVTNPNMGFACQLLQCQKRVHAMPASPNSVLRMYRMAPHSPYDPLHLVPKLLSQPGVRGLDSRGAFVVHVPSAIYVWVGKSCVSVMSDSARTAAYQVIRYERAQGLVMIIKEGDEPSEFWEALGIVDGCNEAEARGADMPLARNDRVAIAIQPGIGDRKFDYDLDFEIFHRALADGVVPPFSLSGTGSETCLPARENGWGRLRRKFACGIMKEFITSSKLSCNTTESSHEPGENMEACKEIEYPVLPTDPSLPSSSQCGSEDSFSSFATTSANCIKGTCEEVEQSSPLIDPLSSPSPPSSLRDSFPYFVVSHPEFSSTSPSLSPSTSDYSGSFNFSPSSSNWSDLSYLSAQPSPSGMQSKDLYSANNSSLGESACVNCKKAASSSEETFSTNHASGVANTCLPCKGISPSIAERRGSNPPPPMMLPPVDDASHVSTNLVRSCSFSLPDLEDEMMRDLECKQFDEEGSYEMDREERVLEAEIDMVGDEFQNGLDNEIEYDTSHYPLNNLGHSVAKVASLVVYHWPSMHKVERHCFDILDSGSIYIMFVPDVSMGTNNLDVLYVWLGRDVLCEKGHNQLINNDGTCRDSHVQWEKIAHNFLAQRGLETNSIVQIVREGEEPEQLLKHLQCFSFQKALGNTS
ncbi:unnamed protein product [Ilex paraguariensis]|uniref:Protein-tyrosine-phosphatase MKP1 n=1 Tax=Ilex paraguariensis TaxID=185542 RepID=A0ABC8U7R3_9AQUA